MKRSSAAFILIMCILLSGCFLESRKEPQALKIGSIDISRDEFDAAFDSSAFSRLGDADKGEFLNSFITRKLILKEAEKMGVDKDPQFLQSIQLFWEQSLLKLALQVKTRELMMDVKVSDQDIKDYFASNKDMEFHDKEIGEVYDAIKWILMKKKQNDAVDVWIQSLHDKEDIKINYDLLGIDKQYEEGI